MPWSDRTGTVTVIAVVAGEPPARLSRMLAAVAAQDAPGPLELVVAAPPADLAVLRSLLTRWERGPVTLLPNPGGSRTRGLNACLGAARGRVVVRVDARSVLGVDHVRRCVARLDADADVAVVGGHQVATAPAWAGTRARGIARALRNRYLLGAAAYRRPEASGPTDTVYLGAFRRDELRAVGYDERLTANEDFDVCARFRAKGRTVHLEAGLAVAYEPRSTYRSLARQYHDFGRSKVAYWRARGARPGRRQLVALGIAPLAVVGAAAVATKWPVAVPALAAVGLAGYLTADAVGTRESAPFATRVAAVAAHGVVEAGWLGGIVAEAVRPARSGDVEHPLQRDAGELGGRVVDDDLVDRLAAGQ